MIESATSSLPSSAMALATPFERECTDFFAEAVHIFGVPKSVGQIYGLLYATPEPLSHADIVERLGISKGSASQGLHFLRSLGAINVADTANGSQIPNSESEIATRGSRIAYVPELSLRKLMSGVLRERVSPLTATGAGRLSRLRELAEHDSNESDFYLDRVKQLATWRRRLKTVLPVLNKLLAPKK